MKETIALNILHKLVVGDRELNKLSPSQVVTKLWAKYKADYESNNSTNGSVFEEIIGFVFAKEGCLPFYMQAKVAYVPNVNYDFIFYDEALGPISLSAKTSLRERWKQADLEAVALKYVHRNALSYAITLNKDEAKTRLNNLKDCMALNDFILADSDRFNELVDEIKTRKLQLAGSVEVITSNMIVDKHSSLDRYLSVYSK